VFLKEHGLFSFPRNEEEVSMDQRTLNREVAHATGETTAEIAHRGFSVAHWLVPTVSTTAPIDWDVEQPRRNVSLLPHRQQRWS